MTELDPQTKAWLNSLKINKTFSSISEFENGYNFVAIFDKLQLTRGKKFKNSSDLGCIFQNYKNVRDLLLQNFNYDFPINNIIYRTADILKVLRQQTSKYIQQKKIMQMKAATSVGSFGQKTLIQPHEQKQFKNREKQISAGGTLFNQTAKMPKKIQDIEKKLDKFKEEKTRHQLVALQERKQEIEQYRRVVMNNREMEISKVKKLHEEGKQKQRKVYDVWYKTQQIKKQRIQTDQMFDSFQKQKRNKLLESLRKNQVDTLNKGQQMFELNCMRQGIELEHDPDKPLKPDGEFNKVVVMERIKDNIQRHEIQKKQRIKRQNKKRVDAESAKIQSQILWAELNKVDDYSKKFASHFQFCQSAYKVQKRMQAEQQTRKQKCKNKKFVNLPAYQDEQKREQQFRRRKVQYLQNDVKYMQKRWQKQYSIAEEVVEALLQATIEGEQIYHKNDGFFYQQWKNFENQFLNYQDTRKKKSKDTKLYVDYSTFDKFLKQYLKSEGSWKNFHSSKHSDHQSEELTKAVDGLIKKTYPDQTVPLNEKMPLHMPLKIAFSGSKLSGKSSHAAKLAQKYGVAIINPRELIKQAFQLAKPPVQQDPKKAGKKDPKKVEEPTAEKLALKQFGVKLLQKISTFEDAKPEHFIQVIKWKLTQTFKEKSHDQIINEYQAAKQKQKVRHEQALKDFEQALKKPKKDSKKGAPNQPSNEQPPKPNPCFYSAGFVLDDFPFNETSAKLLERQINSYISEQQRINKDAVNIKQKISLILHIPEPPQDNSLKQGTFDLVFSLEVDEQNLLKRKTGRKLDPQTKIIYHPSFNPIPDIKGFAQKLIQLPAPDDQVIKSSHLKQQQQKANIKHFYLAFGLEPQKINTWCEINQKQESVQQTFEKLTSSIEPLLLAKYAHIEKSKQHTKQLPLQQEKNQNSGQQNSQTVQKQQSVQIAKVENQKNISKLILQDLKRQDCQQILNKYTKSVENYCQQIKQCLYTLQSQRSSFSKQLLIIQKKFTSLINRPDDKAGKILSFQQNYNKLLAQQGNLVKDVQASRHLIQRLDQLYDSLWVAIGAKKNQAIQQRVKFKQSNWLNIQSEKIVQTLKNLLQIQLNYLCQTIFMILLLNCKIQNKPSDYVNQYLSLGIAPNLQPILTIAKDPSNLIQNTRLAYYLSQTKKCLESLPAWIQQKYKKMKLDKIPQIQHLLNNFVQHGVRNIQRKCFSVSGKVRQRILQQRSYYQTLLNKMDDWIIQGIKAENDFVYQIYKTIKKSIEQAKKSNVKDLHVRDITQVLLPIRELTLNAIPLRIQTHHKKLPVYSYMIFFQQIKTLANQQGKINFTIFKKYMDKRKKSQLLHANILKIDYDTVEQYLVKDGNLYLRELAIAVVLWDVKVFDDDQLAQYKEKLLKQKASQQQIQFKTKTVQKQVKTSQLDPDAASMSNSMQLNSPTHSYKKRASVITAFPTDKKIKLEDLVLMDGAFDEEEEYIMRHFIFEIFRENDADYVSAQALLDTLSLFDQLQVYRYGDTVMMLNI